MREKKFNLLDEPWILVLDGAQNVREVSLTDALLNAHAYAGLAGELPTQDVAILRLLLAVLHTVFSRVDAAGNPAELADEDGALDRWAELWELGRFPEGPVTAYLEQWRERFWLFHPERPFYQVPEAAAGTEYTAAKLNGTLSESANKIRLFPARLGQAKNSTAYGEAARWLLYVNGYDDTSSKPKGKGLPSPGTGWLGKLGLISAEGDTLFETLMLNLPLVKEDDSVWGKCRPVWERDVPRAGERTEIPLPDNPAELLTVQSRRLILKERDGFVEGYCLLGGDFFQKEGAFAEQMTLWRPVYEKKEVVGYQPKRHDSTKQIWREFSAISDTGPSAHRPGVVSWVARLKSDPDLSARLGKRTTFRIASVQYGDKDFFVSHVFSDTLTFHAGLLGDMGEALRERVEKEIQRCGEAASKVGLLAADLAAAAGGTGDRERRSAGDRGAEAYYSRIDQPFRLWLEELDPAAGVAEQEEQFRAWRETALGTARRIGREMVDQAGKSAFAGREYRRNEKEKPFHYSAPEAYNRFEAGLRKLER